MSGSGAYAKALQALHEYATQHGLTADLDWYDADDDDADPDNPGDLTIRFPNGRDHRHVVLDADDALSLVGHPIEEIVFLGDFSAVADRSTGVIEARVASTATTPGRVSRPIRGWTIPGAEIVTADSTSDQLDDTDGGTPAGSRPPRNWRLRVEHGQTAIELSPPSSLARSILYANGPMSLTLKLSGFAIAEHEAALDVLARYGGSFLFELDVMYGISLSLTRRRVSGGMNDRQKSKQAPKFPRNSYAPEALALYEYGRSSSGLPLLQFLAYYQALEYFFPAFAHEQTARSIRQTLLNPRFDATDDAEISRLIGMAAPAVRAGIGEREQLRSTLRGCLTKPELREFVQSLDTAEQYFTRKGQAIRGVGPVRLQDKVEDIRDQVADRIYTIRCRVVHTKQDGGSGLDDLLLPFSKEASSMGPEIELMRLICQQAILSRAKRV